MIVRRATLGQIQVSQQPSSGGWLGPFPQPASYSITLPGGVVLPNLTAYQVELYERDPTALRDAAYTAAYSQGYSLTDAAALARQAYQAAAEGATAGAAPSQVASTAGAPAQTAPTYAPEVSLTNLSRPGQPPQVGDWLRVSITGGPPNETVTATAVHDGGTSTSEMGRTDAGGRWSRDVQMSAAEVGHWVEHWRVGNFAASPTLVFDVAKAAVPAAPTVYTPKAALVNLSRPGQTPQVGDWLRVSITGGAPNQTVTATAIHDGSTSTTEMGRTDGSGAWSKDVQMTAAEVGHWVEHWRVGNTPATPSLTFDVAAAPTPAPGGATPAPAPGAPAGGGGQTEVPAGAAGFIDQVKQFAQSLPWYVWAGAAGALLLMRGR
jgi:hypothetical protein